MSFLRNPRANGPDSPAPPSLATRSGPRLVRARQPREIDDLEMDDQPEDRKDDRRDPGRGDELPLELGVDRRAGIRPVVGQARVGAALHAQRQDCEQHRPPDGQVDGDQGDGSAHQWLPVGVAMSSTSTPPMSLGWTKITGTPWAPMRGSP